MHVSVSVFVEQLLDAALMTEAQKLAVRTTASESEDFEIVAACMRRLFHDTEAKEKDSSRAQSKSFDAKPRPRHFNAFRSLGLKGWQAKRGGHVRPRAHLAEASDEEDEEPPPCA